MKLHRKGMGIVTEYVSVSVKESIYSGTILIVIGWFRLNTSGSLIESFR